MKKFRCTVCGYVYEGDAVRWFLLTNMLLA